MKVFEGVICAVTVFIVSFMAACENQSATVMLHAERETDISENSDIMFQHTIDGVADGRNLSPSYSYYPGKYKSEVSRRDVVNRDGEDCVEIKYTDGSTGVNCGMSDALMVTIILVSCCCCILSCICCAVYYEIRHRRGQEAKYKKNEMAELKAQQTIDLGSMKTAQGTKLVQTYPMNHAAGTAVVQTLPINQMGMGEAANDQQTQDNIGSLMQVQNNDSSRVNMMPATATEPKTIGDVTQV